jgi:hypothetical protein
VGREHALEQRRSDLVRLVLDELLQPVDDEQEPVAVDAADVDGATPRAATTR